MWRNRNVWIVLAGEFIASLGLWMSIIANLEFMQAHVPSDFMKSLILFTGLLAGVMVGPLAGRVIDANKKKTILIYSGIGRLISVCFMFLALAFDSVAWMVMFAVFLQISAAFTLPALQALIPQIVAEKDLITLNGVNMNASTIARILGTALAGSLLMVVDLYTLYMASFVAYVLLLLSTMMLRVDEAKKEDNNKRHGSKGSFKEVIPMLKNMPVATMALIISIVPLLFIGAFNLMVINISEMHQSSQIKGALYAVEGICFIVAAFLVRHISGNGNLLNRLYLFSVMIAISQFMLLFADYAWVALASFGLFGFAAGCYFPLLSTYFQTTIPKEYHGRFFSFRSMIDRVMFQVVLLTVGLLLDTIGLQYMAGIFGALSLALILVSMLRFTPEKQVKTATSTEQAQ
ncbi:MFS transporter [Paenibacillus sp. SC116]|uniref:MFS transporter n=1 Tax=Paenibacillus sp. SC116 TaxID=2968986 RepID=UPI00215A7F5C|nr:MFS transporter [Paenibacillus sp. SC116]MCR8845372.1 MFS transporter [Paenibacillus sp. SC116]